MADSFNISEFRSHLNKTYHRTAHFNMLIDIPLSMLAAGNGPLIGQLQDTWRQLHFEIESSNVPGVAFATDEIRRYGIGAFERKPYVPIFDTIDILVRSDSEGRMYDFFQTWMKLVINYDIRTTIDNDTGMAGTPPFSTAPVAAKGYEVAYRNDYAIDAHIQMFDEEGGDPTLDIGLKNCFPIHMGNIPLNWADNNIVKFPVTLTFSDWYQKREFKASQPQSNT